MEIAALVLALVALVVALAALGRASRLQTLAEEARGEASRLTANLDEKVQAELGTSRRLLAAVAAGAAGRPQDLPTREQILEGRLWDDVTIEDAKRQVAAGEVELLDVRTPRETAGGVIPGAKLIPVQELEERVKELQRVDRPTIVYCAGGGRSAAACEFLSEQGFDRLLNLTGGFQSWTGPTETPKST